MRTDLSFCMQLTGSDQDASVCPPPSCANSDGTFPGCLLVLLSSNVSRLFLFQMQNRISLSRGIGGVAVEGGCGVLLVDIQVSYTEPFCRVAHDFPCPLPKWLALTAGILIVSPSTPMKTSNAYCSEPRTDGQAVLGLAASCRKESKSTSCRKRCVARTDASL